MNDCSDPTLSLLRALSRRRPRRRLTSCCQRCRTHCSALSVADAGAVARRAVIIAAVNCRQVCKTFLRLVDLLAAEAPAL